MRIKNRTLYDIDETLIKLNFMLEQVLLDFDKSLFNSTHPSFREFENELNDLRKLIYEHFQDHPEDQPGGRLSQLFLQAGKPSRLFVDKLTEDEQAYLKYLIRSAKRSFDNLGVHSVMTGQLFETLYKILKFPGDPKLQDSYSSLASYF